MSQEIFCIVKNMDVAEINTQLAMQCAPVIAGIKISNLLIISIENANELKEALDGTGLMYFKMFRLEKGVTYLIFRREELEEYLVKSDVHYFFQRMGYTEFSIEKILTLFQKRYYQYMIDHKSFPHEMGLLLGYPIEDVKGFIMNEGKNFLYSGYWKVYEQLNQKLELFQRYDMALKELVYLVSKGLQIKEISFLYETDKKAVC